MSKDISLLPKAMRSKESETRKKASAAKALPNFKMHEPEDIFADIDKEIEKVNSTNDWVNVGAEEKKPQPKKTGNFKFAKKQARSEKAINVRRVKKPEKLRVIPPKSKPQTPLTPDQRNLNKDFNSRVKIILILVLGVFIVLALVFVGLMFVKSGLVKKSADLDSQVAQINSQIKLFQGAQGQAQRLKQRASALDSLLNNKVHWTELFAFLEKTTVKNVYYTNFVASRDGDLLLTAKADNYTDVANQILLFEESEVVSSVDLKSMQQVDQIGVLALDDEINFNIMLQLTPEIFSR